MQHTTRQMIQPLSREVTRWARALRRKVTRPALALSRYAIAGLAFIFCAAQHQPPVLPEIILGHAWSSPSIDAGVAYLTIENPTATADILDRATSSISRTVTIDATKKIASSSVTRHSMDMPGMAAMPVMAMYEITHLVIPAHRSVQLAPGGYHLMLMDVQRPLATGSTFDLRLHFRRAGWKTLKTRVRL